MTGSKGTRGSVARRTVVTAVGAAGLGAALVACGGSDDDGGAGDPPATGAADGSTGGDSGTDTETDTDAGSTGGGGAELAKVADIPEGGGRIVGDLVITQPQAGTFKAFSKKCTHQGCAVKSVADNVINCPCHNSNFDAADGSVKSGPATAPLPETKITVEAGAIRLA
ncbi:Rieske (2Fe-2S) protein [Streptomyces yaizuensis]|uniref:Cytochrome bc1 complex Rieske iron-sulfur subunit n=1 Tax=Streptomyces yaizuensis TaxID=2989713 RepID=A0ABQ5NZE6_9ACTN|nr:Rieske (2Fe-2S) protein [Streptomyces sp. YSPA8]GLF95730.1 Rieske (2Fe-2S) protein [Streptomyces sp. YSPA8]